MDNIYAPPGEPTEPMPRGARPRGLREITLLLCVFNLTALLDMPGVAAEKQAALRVVTGTLVIVIFVVLWFFWTGKNWARWLVMMTAVFAIASCLAILSLPTVFQLLAIAEAALALFLLYWLNTRPVKAYFTGVRVDS